MCQSKAQGGRRCSGRRAASVPSAVSSSGFLQTDRTAVGAVSSYVITGDDEFIYTAGGCWHLASRLAARTGWQIVGVSIIKGLHLEGYQHYLVRAPGGNLVDIYGNQSEDEVLSRWQRNFNPRNRPPPVLCAIGSLTDEERRQASAFFAADATSGSGIDLYQNLEAITETLLSQNS